MPFDRLQYLNSRQMSAESAILFYVAELLITKFLAEDLWCDYRLLYRKAFLKLRLRVIGIPPGKVLSASH